MTPRLRDRRRGALFLATAMRAIRIGILYSTDGPYGAIGRDCRAGAELAIEDLRSETRLPFVLEPIFGDPAGRAERYMDVARSMLRESGCRHIVAPSPRCRART